MTRREELAQVQERGSSPVLAGRDRRYLLGLVDELAAALRGTMTTTHTPQLPGLRPCACAVHEAARTLLSDLGPDA